MEQLEYVVLEEEVQGQKLEYVVLEEEVQK